MTLHELKTVNPYFKDIWNMKKAFDVRKKAGNFKVGDKLVLLEYDSKFKVYSNRYVTASIVYILDNPDFCKEGYVILQLSPIIRQVGD